ncbi:oocyte zinc finger protein XlCOF7.1-like isoform X2 [Phyllobates terribilis]|uniref:oocyte zinc finger protein XlCOF7.1-like isoform X2 n=1 Tax=Phyllobates terribilis TaxID=111132 RepID=UPI003CCB5972
MDRERNKMAERILHLTLEILFRLTGEDYTVVKKTSSERSQDPVSEGLVRPLSPITGPPPHPLIHEDINDRKILELAYKMIELLTGEVPIRCQDVTVYFSMEEWEYLEGHKDLYNYVMMEVPQPLTSPDPSSKRTTLERCPRPLLPQDCKQEDPDVLLDYQGRYLPHINTTETYVRGDERCKEEIPTDNRTVLSSKRTTPERCPRPLLPLDCKQEDLNVPQDHQGRYLPHINTTETYVRGDERCKEEIPTDNCTGDCIESSEECLIFSDFAADHFDITPDPCEEHVIVPDTPQDLFRKNLPSNPFQQVLFSASTKTNMQNKRHRRAAEHEIPFIGEKPFSCLECGKCYNTKSEFVIHQRSHTGEKPFSCSECGKCYITKSKLVIHQRIHTGEMPFSCSECGKCFNWKGNLVTHLRIHTGKNPYSCSECGKCFTQKSHLVIHQRTHTGEKPFSCSECGKCFIDKSNLLSHQRIHIGNKPFSCSECGKCFNQKAELGRHQRVHTGEKPFSCSDCGKCFKQKAQLGRHQKIHTGEKPYSCSDCGKCFTLKTHLVIHQKTHTRK